MDFSKVILMTDLDGTLLTDDKQILPGDFEAIERFRRGGGLFTMATGRGYAMAKHIADMLRLDCPAVVYRGGIPGYRCGGAARQYGVCSVPERNGAVAP